MNFSNNFNDAYKLLWSIKGVKQDLKYNLANYDKLNNIIKEIQFKINNDIMSEMEIRILTKSATEHINELQIELDSDDLTHILNLNLREIYLCSSNAFTRIHLEKELYPMVSEFLPATCKISSINENNTFTISLPGTSKPRVTDIIIGISSIQNPIKHHFMDIYNQKYYYTITLYKNEEIVKNAEFHYNNGIKSFKTIYDLSNEIKFLANIMVSERERSLATTDYEINKCVNLIKYMVYPFVKEKLPKNCSISFESNNKNYKIMEYEFYIDFPRNIDAPYYRIKVSMPPYIPGNQLMDYNNDKELYEPTIYQLELISKYSGNAVMMEQFGYKPEKRFFSLSYLMSDINNMITIAGKFI
jgi:hypothetical protein